jgi:hypothetical protein
VREQACGAYTAGHEDHDHTMGSAAGPSMIVHCPEHGEPGHNHTTDHSGICAEHLEPTAAQESAAGGVTSPTSVKAPPLSAALPTAGAAAAVAALAAALLL